MTVENVITLVAAGLAFVASLVAAMVSHYNARFRRFALEKWWERKAEAYAEVIRSLVTLIYSLDRWIRHEYALRTDQEYEPPPEAQKTIYNEYKEVRTKIERAAIEGNYVLSGKAANALSELIKQLRKEPIWPVTWDSLVDCLQGHFKAAQDCLKAVRGEARSDLLLK